MQAVDLTLHLRHKAEVEGKHMPVLGIYHVFGAVLEAVWNVQVN